MGIGAGALTLIVGGWFLFFHSSGNFTYWFSFVQMNENIAKTPGRVSMDEAYKRYRSLPIGGVTDPQLRKLHKLYGIILEKDKKMDAEIGPRPQLDLMNMTKEGFQAREAWHAKRKSYLDKVEPTQKEFFELVKVMTKRYGGKQKGSP